MLPICHLLLYPIKEFDYILLKGLKNIYLKYMLEKIMIKNNFVVSACFFFFFSFRMLNGVLNHTATEILEFKFTVHNRYLVHYALEESSQLFFVSVAWSILTEKINKKNFYMKYLSIIYNIK